MRNGPIERAASRARMIGLAGRSFRRRLPALLIVACVAVLCGLPIAGCGGGNRGPSIAEEVKRARAIQNPRDRAAALVRVAAKQRSAGDLPGSERTLLAAVTACEEIEQPADRADAMIFVAGELCRAGSIGKASSLLKQARQAADQVTEPLERVRLIAALAVLHGRELMKPEVATAHLAGAEKDCAAIENVEFRVQATMELAKAYHRVGAQADADRLTEQAMAAARSLEDARQKCAALATIAVALSQLEQPDAAQRVFQEAEAVADQVGNPHSRAYALMELARKHAANGGKSEAARLLDKAAAAADQVTDSSLRGPLVNRIQEERSRL